MRDRGWRREQVKRVTQKRLSDLLTTWWKTFIEKAQPRHFGHLRKNHYGCGCLMCKPHKWSGAIRHSEKRRLPIDSDE
jgi:hypothetical protein